jgi:hypothetical protein
MHSTQEEKEVTRDEIYRAMLYWPAHWRDIFEERAAIREFEGKAPREVAEYEAWREVAGAKGEAIK